MLLVSTYFVLLVLELQYKVGSQSQLATGRKTVYLPSSSVETVRTSFSVRLLGFAKMLHHHSHTTYQHPSEVTGGIRLYLYVHGLHLSIQIAFQALHPAPVRWQSVLSLMKNRLMNRQTSSICRLQDMRYLM